MSPEEWGVDVVASDVTEQQWPVRRIQPKPNPVTSCKVHILQFDHSLFFSPCGADAKHTLITTETHEVDGIAIRGEGGKVLAHFVGTVAHRCV